MDDFLITNLPEMERRVQSNVAGRVRRQPGDGEAAHPARRQDEQEGRGRLDAAPRRGCQWSPPYS